MSQILGLWEKRVQGSNQKRTNKKKREKKSHFLTCLVIIVIADKRSAHIQTIQRARGQTFGSVQNWCHVKGHEPWLETTSWNVSLKARLKGQRGLRSPLVSSYGGSSWNSWELWIHRLTEGTVGGDFVGIKPLKRYRRACCQILFFEKRDTHKEISSQYKRGKEIQQQQKKKRDNCRNEIRTCGCGNV